MRQDPYIKLTLHDGQYDEGGAHRGESVKTKVKDNAGSNATFNETFVLNKPGVAHESQVPIVSIILNYFRTRKHGCVESGTVGLRHTC